MNKDQIIKNIESLTPEELFIRQDMIQRDACKRFMILIDILVPVVGEKDLHLFHMGTSRRVSDVMEKVNDNIDKYIEYETKNAIGFIRRKFIQAIQDGFIQEGVVKDDTPKHIIDEKRLGEVKFVKSELSDQYKDIATAHELKTQYIDQYFDKFASELTKEVFKLGSVENTVHEIIEDGEHRAHLTQYLGVEIRCSKDKEFDLEGPAERLIEIINWGVKEGHFIVGTLGPMIWMELLSFGKNGEWLLPDGRIVSDFGPLLNPEKLHASVYEGDYQKRGMLLIYPVCTLSRDHLNALIKARFDIEQEVSNHEGSIPTWVIEQ